MKKLLSAIWAKALAFLLTPLAGVAAVNGVSELIMVYFYDVWNPHPVWLWVVTVRFGGHAQPHAQPRNRGFVRVALVGVQLRADTLASLSDDDRDVAFPGSGEARRQRRDGADFRRVTDRERAVVFLQIGCDALQRREVARLELLVPAPHRNLPQRAARVVLQALDLRKGIGARRLGEKTDVQADARVETVNLAQMIVQHPDFPRRALVAGDAEFLGGLDRGARLYAVLVREPLRQSRHVGEEPADVIQSRRRLGDVAVGTFKFDTLHSAISLQASPPCC